MVVAFVVVGLRTGPAGVGAAGAGVGAGALTVSTGTEVRRHLANLYVQREATLQSPEKLNPSQTYFEVIAGWLSCWLMWNSTLLTAMSSLPSLITENWKALVTCKKMFLI